MKEEKIRVTRWFFFLRSLEFARLFCYGFFSAHLWYQEYRPFVSPIGSPLLCGSLLALVTGLSSLSLLWLCRSEPFRTSSQLLVTKPPRPAPSPEELVSRPSCKNIKSTRQSILVIKCSEKKQVIRFYISVLYAKPSASTDTRKLAKECRRWA